MQKCWKNLFSLYDRLHELCAVAPELAGRLTLAQARVIKVIYTRAPEPVILKDIAEELGITPSAVSQTVDWLVRENLVDRIPSPTDRRSVMLRPSRRGEDFRQEYDRKISALMRQFFQPVPAEDASVFSRVLGRLCREADDAWHSRNSRAAANSVSPEPGSAAPTESDRNDNLK